MPILGAARMAGTLKEEKILSKSINHGRGNPVLISWYADRIMLLLKWALYYKESQSNRRNG